MKYLVFINQEPKWRGYAANQEEALHRAALSKHQTWKVKFLTPLSSWGTDKLQKISLHTDHDVPDMITDVDSPSVLPLLHSRVAPSEPMRSIPIGEFIKGIKDDIKREKEAPVKVYGMRAFGLEDDDDA